MGFRQMCDASVSVVRGLGRAVYWGLGIGVPVLMSGCVATTSQAERDADAARFWGGATSAIANREYGVPTGALMNSIYGDAEEQAKVGGDSRGQAFEVLEEIRRKRSGNIESLPQRHPKGQAFEVLEEIRRKRSGN